MLLRIDRLLADRRFEFLFGETGEALPKPAHALATFIRYILGIGPGRECVLSSETDVPQFRFPFYDRQRERRAAVDIVVLDLSLVAAEVLESVTALIGRLVLEFLQRLGEYGGEGARGRCRLCSYWKRPRTTFHGDVVSRMSHCLVLSLNA